MMRYVTMIAIAATIAIALQLPASANWRRFSVEPMSAKDLRQVPAGAAVWFHYNSNYWFYLPIGGHGYMKIDRKLWKFRRIQPTGNTWGCMPMVFESLPGRMGKVRIYKEAAGWTVKYAFGRQMGSIKGLTCANGD